MSIIALMSKPIKKDYNFQPFVSIIIPTYNEANVIQNRISNCIPLNYPADKYEIIIVDSASTDKTATVIQKFINVHKDSLPTIKLIKEKERLGKASAINLGKKFAKSNYILVTDANATFDQNVLKEMMPHFLNEQVGGVGGRYIVANPGEPLAASASYYWDLEYLMRLGESALFSACLFHGEINIWRKDIVDADIKMLSEDLDMCISIIKKGYNIIYEPKAVVYEPAATTINDQIKQRKRTSIGTIQNIFKHRKFLIFTWNWYTKFIFPSHKILAMISPFLFILIPILYFVVWDFSLIVGHVFFSVALFIGFFLTLFFLRTQLLTDANRKKLSGSSSCLGIIHYVLINEYLILLAWLDFFRGRYAVQWEKATTTR
jgi:cellulose synthase/poly-beta-1,6-N-acetylglucosamine synthase-like glycosyltransferase